MEQINKTRTRKKYIYEVVGNGPMGETKESFTSLVKAKAFLKVRGAMRQGFSYGATDLNGLTWLHALYSGVTGAYLLRIRERAEKANELKAA